MAAEPDRPGLAASPLMGPAERERVVVEGWNRHRPPRAAGRHDHRPRATRSWRRSRRRGPRRPALSLFEGAERLLRATSSTRASGAGGPAPAPAASGAEVRVGLCLRALARLGRSRSLAVLEGRRLPSCRSTLASCRRIAWPSWRSDAGAGPGAGRSRRSRGEARRDRGRRSCDIPVAAVPDPDPSEAPAPARRALDARLRDLYLGLHRPAEGRDWRSTPASANLALAHGAATGAIGPGVAGAAVRGARLRRRPVRGLARRSASAAACTSPTAPTS